MEPKVQYDRPSVQDDFKTLNDRRALKKQMKIKKRVWSR